jgi:Antitoxin Phd_YefM, type II toxin-antitoxin system
MKTVSARQANHEFSALLSRAERGEEVLITKHNKPLSITRHDCRAQDGDPHALQLMKKGLHWGDVLPGFTRDEMHDR